MRTKAKKYKHSKKIGAIVSDRVGHHGNHPFFVKKAEEAKAFIAAHGLPKAFEEKNQA